MFFVLICSLFCKDEDPEHRVQRFEQRIGAYEHTGERLHRFYRCDSFQGVVREAVLVQDRSEGRGDEGGSEQVGGSEQEAVAEAAEAAELAAGAEGSDRTAGLGQDPRSHLLASWTVRSC